MGGSLCKLCGAEKQISVQKTSAEVQKQQQRQVQQQQIDAQQQQIDAQQQQIDVQQQQIDALRVEVAEMQTKLDAPRAAPSKPQSSLSERLFVPIRDTCEKVALLVYPDYNGKPWGLIAGNHLQQLRMLCQSCDFKVVELAECEVSAEEVKRALQDAVAQQPEVIMFVYGGHGKPNTSTGDRVGNQHGTLVLSIGTLSEDGIAEALGVYRGTFIQLLIMCSAGASQPEPCNADFSKVGAAGWGKQGQVFLPTVNYKAIQFFASVPEQTIRSDYATKVLKAFVKAKGRPYALIREHWPDEWVRGKDGVDPPFCIMAHDYDGSFPYKTWRQ